MPEQLDQVTAAILAGGLGTRLRAAVADRQKVIAPVSGQPFIYRLLDQLADAGVRQVVLCTGHQAGQVAATLGETYRNMRLRYSAETQPLGTAGALRLALPQFESDVVLAMNGDSFCDVDLAAFWAAHRQRVAEGSLVVWHADDIRERGHIELAENDQVVRFIEKQPQAHDGWINAGIYLLSRLMLETIPTDRAVSIEREMFTAWTTRRLYGFRTTGRFLDIGTTEAYAAAQRFFK